MIITSANARDVFNEFNPEENARYIQRVGVDAAKAHYESEFVQKAADFVKLFNEIDGEYDDQAVAELVLKAQFLAIRADSYAVAANSSLTETK